MIKEEEEEEEMEGMSEPVCWHWALPFDDEPALMFGAQCTCRLMHNVRSNHQHMAGTAAVSDQTFTLPLDRCYTMDMSRLPTQKGERPHRHCPVGSLSTTAP